MKPVAPLGLIHPLGLGLGLGRGGRRWRGGPLVPMIWRRRLPVRTPQAAPVATPSIFSSTYVFNLSLAWPAGTATRIETLRTQLATPTGRGPAASRSVEPTGRLWTRLEKNVLHFTHRVESLPATRGAAEAPSRPAPAPLPPRLPARSRTAIAAASPRSPAPRAAAVRLWTRQPAMRPIAATRLPGEAAAAPLARVPTALIWRTEDAGGGTAAASPALPGISARRGAELVWRRPAPGEAGTEARAAPEMASPRAPSVPAAWRGEAQAGAGRPAAPTAIPPVEMGRLVDEVVRRLDRIGRDERLRRGL